MFTLDDLQTELARFTNSTGVQATEIPGLSLIRFSEPSEPCHNMVSPALCIVAQGKKRTATAPAPIGATS